MTDTIDFLAASGEILASFAEVPLRRHEVVSLSPDGWRRLTQMALEDELRAAGMSPVARRVSRIIIPPGHVLAFIADDGVRWRVIDLRDEHDGLLPEVDAKAEPEPARGSSAGSVLGALGGGTR